MVRFENKTNGRFYYIEITKDLVNEHILRVTYGGYRVTRYRNLYVGSRDAMELALAHLTKRRLRRGYDLLTA